jgi:hypothetical protein
MFAAKRQTSGAGAQGASTVARGAADLLCLAAAPTFAIIALLATVLGGSSDMPCAPAGDPSPLSGMGLMYLLMSVFHCPPWLRGWHKRR